MKSGPHAIGANDREKSYSLPYELFPTGPFELPAALRRLRDMKKSARGPDIAALMDQAVAELADADSLTMVPGVGDPAPKFELPNQIGALVSLDGLLATGPAVLVFYRGVWCPFCTLTLRAYEQYLPDLRSAGASLVGISLQTPDDSLTMAERNRLSYPVLSDLGGAVSSNYGLVFKLPNYLQEVYRQLGHPLPAFNGTDDWELPVSATFVVDRSGLVRFAEALPDYTQRSDPADVLATVMRL
ncbi:peroxiredoxin-like family protein [Mycobacterium kubicae]|uniref:thioredoxin-dependent peroxiredoxin n=3 Tax=Mycobacterium kubicae TaxID=120959 RepID=A0AAX1J9H7_9MYCO|nr:peroxiredoxin-like family protein [Mycobacterium kubicae]MCV7094215.1 AhpC/TSA family protein [Mycobacterium kubicae]QNI09970.1 AhpC/TSA family protein [Mycobacterium kubicae]QPI38169.1 AhpC/TSA family protein [Mycobacterium kubicae]